jgi:hypothetical protein
MTMRKVTAIRAGGAYRGAVSETGRGIVAATLAAYSDRNAAIRGALALRGALPILPAGAVYDRVRGCYTLSA